jgi:hypothetical protein
LVGVDDLVDVLRQELVLPLTLLKMLGGINAQKGSVLAL